jgi:hypothetical protein
MLVLPVPVFPLPLLGDYRVSFPLRWQGALGPLALPAVAVVGVNTGTRGCSWARLRTPGRAVHALQCAFLKRTRI